MNPSSRTIETTEASFAGSRRGQACADDSGLRRQVESMLADVDQPIVVDRPVGEAIADLMDDDTPVVVGTESGPYRVESLEDV